ncbi:hypothetical protein [Geminicoccus harenae]|uniref:hypothetical protein n=1 Tax=Geminicoccus harenae TaxID=2498453 RepID=UPI00168AE0A4|nr:hypothetical protein [Geminicoccus harenae]
MNSDQAWLLEQAIKACRKTGAGLLPPFDSCGRIDRYALTDEALTYAIETNVQMFRDHTRLNESEKKRVDVIDQIKEVERLALELANCLHKLHPRAKQALADAADPMKQELHPEGAIVRAFTDEDIILLQDRHVPLAARLELHAERAALAAEHFPSGKGNGNTLFRQTYGTPKGQLVVRLLDLLFPSSRHDLKPSGTATGTFNTAVVAVAAYANIAKASFGHIVRDAARLHAERASLLRAAPLHQDQARQLRRIGHAFRTL